MILDRICQSGLIKPGVAALQVDKAEGFLLGASMARGTVLYAMLTQRLEHPDWSIALICDR